MLLAPGRQYSVVWSTIASRGHHTRFGPTRVAITEVMVTGSDGLVVTEHWTDSHTAVVLAGRRSALEAIAELLGLPTSRITTTRANTAVLGLWDGDSLDAYEDLKRTGRIQSQPDRF